MHILRYKIVIFGDTDIAENPRTGARRRQTQREETTNSTEVVEVEANHKRTGFNSPSSLLQNLQCPIKNSIEDALEETKD